LKVISIMLKKNLIFLWFLMVLLVHKTKVVRIYIGKGYRNINLFLKTLVEQ
jgi:hypothetical protein